MTFFPSLLALTAAAFLLTGCLGSEIVGRRPENPAEFPSLHSVPERPPKEDESAIQRSIRTEEHAQQKEKARGFNQELRHYFGVPSSPDKNQKTKIKSDDSTAPLPAQ
jgi:hypothetical protein